MTNKGYDAAEVQKQEDDLDRWRFAAEVVEVVSATPSDWSARIGIFGKWGEGKTTVLRFAETMLREKGSIVFSFSPWAVQNWNDLWEEFGNHISEALDAARIPFDHSWKESLKSRGKWLEQNLESTGIGQLAESAASIWGKDKLYNAAFGTLSRWLRYDGDQIRAIRKKLGQQRLVVLIDDLDRCPPELVPQLLLSLRELLDLPGFTFLLAFDDEIVAQALTQKNPAWVEGANFLEKILDFRFHLPAVTDLQKARLTLRAMQKYCPFVPMEATKQIQDLLPNNPRKLKSLIRSLAAIQPQLTRHDPDELVWVDVWIAQMLRLESYRFFERLLRDDTLDKETGPLSQAIQRHSRSSRGDVDEYKNVKALMQEVGVQDLNLEKRLIQLIGAARSRTSIRFRYMCELALRPHAVTWKEFRLLYEKWSADRRPSVLSEWMSRHAKERSVNQEDVQVELFDAIIGKRATSLSAAAESKSVEEQDSHLVEAGALLQMIEQLLLDLGKLTPQRFGKLFDQSSHWIGFRKNNADLQQRKLEEKLIFKLLSSASTEQSVGIYEQVLPERWDFDMGDGTLPMRRALRGECEKLVAAKAAEEAIGFMIREGAIHSLTEQGRFTGVKHCLFQSCSPVWTSNLRNKLLAIIRKGRTDPTIYFNVRDFFDLIVYGLERGIDSVGPRDISSLLSDERFVSTLWRTVTSRKIQYRLQMTFIQARQSLIKAGASELVLPLPEELQSRLDEEASRQKAKIGAATDLEDSSVAQAFENESQN